MTAFEMLTDLIEDPNNNGDYRLNVSGDELARLYRAVENADLMLRSVCAAKSLETARRRAEQGLHPT